MRTKVKQTSASPEAKLTRLLEALEQEVIDASDEEILAAAIELGMNPKMKGSALFAGLRYPTRPQLADFFDLGVGANASIEAQQTPAAIPERTGAPKLTPKLTK
jgi:hypothetical protein